ncbi:MAG: XRE family transcriptional regulator [Mu-like cryoconite phage AB09]|nr:MAG: XRE family transcriptional regulator [Mu-like cryoconite phage AB09]
MDLFAERLNKFVKQLGWSQEELGHRSGVTTSSINMYLLSKREPSLDVIDRIAKAIGVPSRVFFEDADFPILNFMPSPKDAIRILEKALEGAAFLPLWKRSELEVLAQIKEDDDRATVLVCARGILSAAEPQQSKESPPSSVKKKSSTQR